MSFKKFSEQVREKYKSMEESGQLYTVAIQKDDLWKEYLSSFPAGTNEIAFENRQYDCNACKKFIKVVAGVVQIVDGELVSIWDVDADGYYADVANHMSALVKSSEISNKFIIRPEVTANRIVGGLTETVKPDNTTIYRDKIGMTYSHFNTDVSKELIKVDAPTILAKIEGNFISYKRSCKEIDIETISTAKELIAGGLYRGEEELDMLNSFENLLAGYNSASNKNIYLWSTIDGPNRTIRKRLIGKLLLDIQEKGVDEAVKRFEKDKAPENFKRTNAIVTPTMKKKHLGIIRDAGIEESLYKRYAVLGDVSVNDVLFVDSRVSAKMADGIEGLMEKGVTSSPSVGTIRDTLSLDDFVSNVVPKAKEISLLLENSHTGNMVSLISPQVEDAPNIQEWGNNFSWAYSGGVTDSMKERVKSAGGNVDGYMRFSIQWNEDLKDRSNDLDAHCDSPEGHIYYSNKMGRLDVDVTNPKEKVAVENITWPTKRDILDGKYRFSVRNYARANRTGFRAELEIDGVVHSFAYNSSIPEGKVIPVVDVTYKDNVVSMVEHLSSSLSSKDVWGVKTNELVKVDSIMFSPNYWGDNNSGNKHTFFMLEGCKNPDSIRGLYNEHLHPQYREIRKSIDMLAPMLECKYSDNQISGVGFSSTKPVDLTLVVRGDGVSGTYKIEGAK